MKTTESVGPTEAIQTAIKIGYFAGALSGFQRVAFRDLAFAGFDRKVAHKMAIDYASQLGMAMRNDDNLSTKISKANKSGVCKLSGSFSDKLIMHNACAIIRIVQTIAGLVQDEKLLTSYACLNLEALNDRLQGYITECTVWASEQKWENVT